MREALDASGAAREREPSKPVVADMATPEADAARNAQGFGRTVDGDMSQANASPSALFPAKTVSFPANYDGDEHVLLEGAEYLSLGNIIDRVNSIYYKIIGGEVFEGGDFVTRVSRDPLTAMADAENFYAHLVDLSSKGAPIPDEINIAEFGIGNGRFAADFLGHFKAIDRHGFYSLLRYHLIDFSKTILAYAVSNPLLKTHAAVTRFFTPEEFHAAPGEFMYIRFNELYDDFPGVIYVEKHNGAYYEVKCRLTVNSRAKFEKLDGTPVTLDDFIHNYWQGGDESLKELNPSFLNAIMWEETRDATPINLMDHPAGRYLASLGKNLRDGRFPVNVGAMGHIRWLLSLLDDKHGGILRFYDYFFTDVDSYMALSDTMKIRRYGGSITCDVNIPYLLFELDKVTNTEMRYGAQEEFLTEELHNRYGTVKGAELGWRISELIKKNPVYIAIEDLENYESIRKMSEEFVLKNPENYKIFITKLKDAGILSYPAQHFKYIPHDAASDGKDPFLFNLEYQVNFRINGILEENFGQMARLLNPSYAFKYWVTEKSLRNIFTENAMILRSMGLFTKDLDRLTDNILKINYRPDFHYFEVRMKQSQHVFSNEENDGQRSTLLNLYMSIEPHNISNMSEDDMASLVDQAADVKGYPLAHRLSILKALALRSGIQNNDVISSFEDDGSYHRLISAIHPYNDKAAREIDSYLTSYRGHGGAYFTLRALKEKGRLPDDLIIVNADPHDDLSHGFIFGDPVTETNWASAALRDGLAKAYIQISRIAGHEKPCIFLTYPGGSGYTEQTEQQITEEELASLLAQHESLLTIDADYFSLGIDGNKKGTERSTCYHDLPDKFMETMAPIDSLFEKAKRRPFRVVTAESPSYLSPLADVSWMVSWKRFIAEHFMPRDGALNGAALRIMPKTALGPERSEYSYYAKDENGALLKEPSGFPGRWTVSINKNAAPVKIAAIERMVKSFALSLPLAGRQDITQAVFRVEKKLPRKNKASIFKGDNFCMEKSRKYGLVVAITPEFLKSGINAQRKGFILAIQSLPSDAGLPTEKFAEVTTIPHKPRVLFFQQSIAPFFDDSETAEVSPTAFTLASILKQAGFDISINEFNFIQAKRHMKRRGLIKALRSILRNTDVVCLSVCDPLLPIVREFSEALREAKPGIVIIVGGPSPTIMPEHVAAYLKEVNVIYRGEAETGLVPLLNTLGNINLRRPDAGQIANLLDGQKGIIAHFGGTFNFYECASVNRADEMALNSAPYDFSLLTAENIKGAFTISTSRGCKRPGCSFCATGNARRYVAMRPERVVKVLENYERRLDELEAQGAHLPPNARHVNIVDNNFLENPERALSILSQWEEKGLRLKLLTIQTDLTTLLEHREDDTIAPKISLIKAVAAHGNIFVDGPNMKIGTEAVGDEEIRRLGKGTYTYEEIESVVAECEKYGLKNAHYLILMNADTSVRDMIITLARTAVLVARYKLCRIEEVNIGIFPLITTRAANNLIQHNETSLIKRFSSNGEVTMADCIPGFPEYSQYSELFPAYIRSRELPSSVIAAMEDNLRELNLAKLMGSGNFDANRALMMLYDVCLKAYGEPTALNNGAKASYQNLASRSVIDEIKTLCIEMDRYAQKDNTVSSNVVRYFSSRIREIFGLDIGRADQLPVFPGDEVQTKPDVGPVQPAAADMTSFDGLRTPYRVYRGMTARHDVSEAGTKETVARQVGELVDTVKICAYNEKRKEVNAEKRNIMVAVEIPDDAKQNPQLIAGALRQVVENLERRGMLGSGKTVEVKVVWAKTNRLYDKIIAENSDFGAPLSNIVVLGKEATLTGGEFAPLRGKAFFACTDFTKWPDYVKLLTIAMKLAFTLDTADGLKVKYGDTEIEVLAIADRIVRLLPKTVPIDTNEPDKTFRLQISELKKHA